MSIKRTSCWFNCCKKHRKDMKKDAEREGYDWFATPDADKRRRCDYSSKTDKRCKSKAYYEFTFLRPEVKKSLEKWSKKVKKK